MEIKPELTAGRQRHHELLNSGGDYTDGDLTSLAWLQDGNLLKHLPEEPNEDNENVWPTEKIADVDDCESVYRRSAVSSTTASAGAVSAAEARDAKPAYSFSSLIFMAIESAPSKAMPVKDIYQWIVDNYPYFQTAPSGWKNTVRHNLSLNKCFCKLNAESDETLSPISGKGSLWCVDPTLRPNLLQAVRRTPTQRHPYQSFGELEWSPRVQLSSNRINALLDPKKTLTADTTTKRVAVNFSPASLPSLLSQRLLIPITKIASNDNVPDSDISRNTSADTLVTVTVNPVHDHNYYSQKSWRQYRDRQKAVPIGSRVKDEPSDEDSTDAGLMGAEALLNLAASNKAETEQRFIF